MIGGQSDHGECAHSRAKIIYIYTQQRQQQQHTAEWTPTTTTTITPTQKHRYSLAHWPNRKKDETLKYISQMQIGCGNASDLRTYRILLSVFLKIFSFYSFSHLIPGIYRWFFIIIILPFVGFSSCSPLNGTCSWLQIRIVSKWSALHDVMPMPNHALLEISTVWFLVTHSRNRKLNSMVRVNGKNMGKMKGAER